jgi:hypothetical protein
VEEEPLPIVHPEIKEAAKVNANMSRMLASFDTEFFPLGYHTRDQLILTLGVKCRN